MLRALVASPSIAACATTLAFGPSADGLVFLVGAAHAAIEPSTIAEFEPLRTWMVILMLAGGAAWLYRVVLFNRLGPRYGYRLAAVGSRGSNIIDLVMRPIDRRHDVRAGDLRLLARSRSGTASEGTASVLDLLVTGGSGSACFDPDSRRFHPAAPALESGTQVDVYGPFGGFTSHRFAISGRMVRMGPALVLRRSSARWRSS